MKRALLYIPDLFFAPRIADALKHLDFAAREPGRQEEISDALAGMDLLVVQLDGPRELWLAAIRTARAAGVPVLAFGRHTEAETLRAARHAGANKVVPNSQLVAELPQLVGELMSLKA